MFDRSCFWKPQASTETLYVAGESAGKLYSPELLDSAFRVTPVAASETLTEAPTMALPDGSVTMPLISPLPWAMAG